MGNRKIIILLLVLVTGLAAWLRFFHLGSAPPSVNWDEASFGYNSYSLWETGRDEYGAAIPISFRSFDDYKPPVYFYLTAPIVGIFGLNEFNTRFASAIFSVLAVLIVFVLVSKISGKLHLGLISSLVLATAPTMVHFGRAAYEAVPGLTLFLISLVYLLKARVDTKQYIPAYLFSILAYFSYNSFKVYWILIVFWIVWNLGRQIGKNIKVIAVCVLLSLPVGYSVLFTNSLARFSSTSIIPILVETGSVYKASEELVNRYMANFSPANVFVRGTNEPNQKVFGFSIFFPFQFVFFLAGLKTLYERRRKEKFFLFWLFTAPAPAVLSWSWFSPIRILPLWVLMTYIIALGIEFFWVRLKQMKLRIASFAAITIWWTISAVWLVMYLVWYMPFNQYGMWQWGFREAVAEITPIVDNYQKVVWESPHAQPYIFVLFYSKYDPEKYQAELPPEYKTSTMRDKWDFGKYEFRKIYWPVDRGATPDTLFVGGVYSLPEPDISKEWRIVRDVIEPAGYVNFRIVGASATTDNL